MIEIILIIFFSIVSLFSLVFGIIISYHFKRFAIIELPGTKKVLKIFALGSFFFFILNLIFLILTI